RQARAERLDRLRALRAGLARGDAQLDQLALAEERHARGARHELAPVEAPLGEEHGTLGEPLRARLCADRVGGLEREQRVVAVNRVQRPELAPEMAVELLEPQRGHVYSNCGRAATRRRRICCTMSVCMSR